MGHQMDQMDQMSNHSDMDQDAHNDEATGGIGHQLSANDPDNPQNWPFYRKVYASSVAFSFAFAV